MSSNSDDIQAAGSDTRPPMLDRTDCESWSQRIRLYCRGKENGLQILQSIDQGPFELGTTRDTLGTTLEGGLPKDIYKLINHNIEAKAIWDNVKMLLAGFELTKEDQEPHADECDAFDSDVDDEPTAQSIFMANLSSAGSTNPQAGNVIDTTRVARCGLTVIVIPYEQYLLVDNIFPVVSKSCASSALNDVCVSSDNYAFVPHDPIATELKIYKEQVAIYEQRAKFELTEREQRMDDQMLCYIHIAKKAQPTLYDGEELLKTHHVPVIVPSSKEDLELAETTRKKLHAKMNDSACVEKRINITPPNYLKENFMVTFTPQTQLTPEQVFYSIDLAKQKAEELKANALPLPVLPPMTVAMKAVFENLEAEVDQNEIDLMSGEIKWKNLLITNENLIAECLSNDVFYTTTNSVLNVSRFSNMHDAFTIAQKRIADLESENFSLRNKIQNDDHDSMIKHFSKLEVEHFNLQLKYQNLKESFGNKKPVTSSDAPLFDSLFMIGKLNEQIQSRGNTIHELKEKISRLTKMNSDADLIFNLKALVSQNKDLTAKLNALHDLNECFRAENAKVKQHYKELYDSIKITRAKTTDQNNSLLSEIENLKAQLKDNSKCVTIPDSKPKVLAPGRYPIDIEPIPPRHKNNREVHLHYIKHLKESVETLREIVEDAKVERPLDTSIASACRYTKHSQELLEYVIGTCPKDFSPRVKQNASTTSPRKKRVTFVEPCETSTHNTPAQVEHQKIHSTNALGIPFTGVKGASVASRSKPRSNTKKDRTLPAKSALKQVEAHSRMNKSNEKQKNRVDSSISYKRTIINSNSITSCKTCNKCLISVNHD
ncbi:hypothetical protein Tco_0431721 [Tanacetum coccineum]